MTGSSTVAVVGAGSWGTAFAMITAGKDVRTVLWARRADLADAIASRHENPDYLPGLSRAVVDLASRVDVEVPISEHVVKVIYEGLSPAEAVRSLMLREVGAELQGIQ